MVVLVEGVGAALAVGILTGTSRGAPWRVLMGRWRVGHWMATIVERGVHMGRC